MKRVMLGLALAMTVSFTTGCEVLQKRNCNSGCNSCNNACNGPIGCRPCNIGWQRGGTDYQRFLSNAGGRFGIYNHTQPAGYGGPSGPATAQVAYPYYTSRGPRDFFVNDPPSIGR